MYSFEWDDDKNLRNKAKYGFDFTTAIQVFFDPLHVIEEDTSLNYDEYRYIAVGRVANGETILLVVHAYPNDEVIRIISARKASKGEVNGYGYY